MRRTHFVSHTFSIHFNTLQTHENTRWYDFFVCFSNKMGPKNAEKDELDWNRNLCEKKVQIWLPFVWHFSGFVIFQHTNSYIMSIFNIFDDSIWALFLTKYGSKTIPPLFICQFYIVWAKKFEIKWLEYAKL
jgi:hypothetical protein